MADFSISFDPESDIIKYLESFRANIDKTPLFSARLFVDHGFAFFHIKPLIFPFYYIAPFIWVMGFMFAGGFSFPVFVVGCIPGISYLLYTKYWYIMALYAGKWKGKYKGKIKVL